MKLFGRSSGYWLFWLSAIYLIVGFVNVFVYKFTEAEYIQMVWFLVLSLPLFVKPLANWLNMRTLWERE